jgi:hypothetical protein
VENKFEVKQRLIEKYLSFTCTFKILKPKCNHVVYHFLKILIIDIATLSRRDNVKYVVAVVAIVIYELKVVFFRKKNVLVFMSIIHLAPFKVVQHM